MSDDGSDQRTIENFDHDNPLRRFMAGSPVIEPCATDELKGALDRHIRLVTDGASSRLRVEHTVGNLAESAIRAHHQVLNELREIYLIAESRLDVRRSDWTIAYAGAFGEMIPAVILRHWKEQAVQAIPKVNAASTGDELQQVLGDFLEYVAEIRKRFFQPLIEELAGIMGSSKSAVTVNAQGALSDVLEAERQKRLNSLEQQLATSADNAKRSSGDAAIARQGRTFEQFASDEASLSKW